MKNKSRFAFDAPVESETAEGGEVFNWAEQFTCWVHADRAGSGSAVSDGGVVQKTTARVALRVAPETLAVQDDWRARDISQNQPGEIWKVVSIDQPAPGAGYLWMALAKGSAP